MSAVSVDDLSKSFGAVRAVDAMSWSAESGAVTTILGPNGAGKTTTMECLEGLQRPDGGRARVLDQDPWRAPAEHRARVGVMLQDGGLPNGSPPMPLLRHLAALYEAPRDVAALATRLGIDAFKGTTVRRLSGGQRRRVALAAALVGDPDVLFLDEPTAGLDPHAREEVFELIREERARGACVVVTTHSFEEAAELADQVVIVHQGRTVTAGTLDDVCAGRPLKDVYFELTSGSRP